MVAKTLTADALTGARLIGAGAKRFVLFHGAFSHNPYLLLRDKGFEDTLIIMRVKKGFSKFMAIFCGLLLLGGVGKTEILSSLPGESKEAYEARMRWWKEARFGIFIHWGPVSIMGTEIGWSRGNEVPVEVYDNLYKQFNPVKFDPQQWARLFKEAGAKYVVIVTKHHDGFSMFESALTDYDCMNTPAKRDFVGELVKACREQGLKVEFYYSLCDWYHPYYLPRPSYIQDPLGHQRDFNKYLEFMFGQIRELCEKYRPDGIWFDGGWEHPPNEWRSEELFGLIHGILPGALINNRAGLPGDYDTPEQTVGAFNRERFWESCITLGTQWAWKPNDMIKSLKKCLFLLIQCAGGDGNLLLNVGPTPLGEIEERQAEILSNMGEWLKKYGEGIYGTRGGPFKPGRWGASTCKGNYIYLFVFHWDGESLLLPPIGRKVVQAFLLTGGKVDVRQTGDGIEVRVPKQYQRDLATVARLKLDGPAEDIPPCEGPLVPMPIAKASNVFQGFEAFGADKAIDDDETTRWATDWGIKSAWLEVDYGKVREFRGVEIKEAEEFGKRIKRFALEYSLDGKEWRILLMGTTVGANFRRRFLPRPMRYVRLNILEAVEGPTIWEFRMF